MGIIIQASRSLQWPDTSQLPQADADFVAGLEAFVATMPGDAVIIYNATNGDKVTIIAQQDDRAAFKIPEGVVEAPTILPPAKSLAIDPDSVTALALALTNSANDLAKAAVTASLNAPPVVAPASNPIGT